MTLFRSLTKVIGRRPKQIPLADSTKVEAHREQIDDFLTNVLAADEKDFVAGCFISDQATIFDCSMNVPATWIANCKDAYNVDIGDQLHRPLWELALYVKERQ